MASKYLLHNHASSQSEVLIVEPRHSVNGNKLTVIGSSATVNYIVDLPPGVYRLGMYVDSNLTGTTTAINDIVPFLNRQQVKVASATLYEFTVLQPTDGAVADKTIALPAGDSGAYVLLSPSSATAQQRETPLLHGLQITVTKGGAVAGEKFEVLVVAQRVQ